MLIMSEASLIPRLPEPGAVIDEKYEIVALVGRGGMGAVFEAMHVRLNQRVAIKMLHPYVKDLPGSIERFEREARAAGQLQSPNITRVLDVETKKTALPYMVMEFLDGKDLGQELAAHGRLPICDAVDYLLQACAGMREAHAAGIIHRDLKPANIFLCRTPEGPVIKVVDFGISKITTEVDGRLTAAMTTMGSPVYMSPEQLREAKDVDQRADIWGLGVILFELITGRTPHTGTVTVVTAAIVSEKPPTLSALRSDVPAGLDAVVAKALAKKPDDRYPDAESFAEALAPFASREAVKRLRASLSIPAAPPSSKRSVSPASHDQNAETMMGTSRLPGVETSQSWSSAELGEALRSKRRSRVLIAATGAAIVATIAIIIGVSSRSGGPPEPTRVAATTAPPEPAAAPTAPAPTVAAGAKEEAAPLVAAAPPASSSSARAPAKVVAPTRSLPAPNPKSNPLHL